MEIEYNPDTDEYYIVMPESVLNRLHWEEGMFIEYDIEDEMLKLFAMEE